MNTFSTAAPSLEWNVAVVPFAAQSENANEKCAGTILYVEDEGFVREVTREVLEAAGYCVLAVKDAADAATAYREHSGRIDLLLTDVVLPGEGGRALAARLKRQNHRLKVILASGYGEQMARGEISEHCWQEHCWQEQCLSEQCLSEHCLSEHGLPEQCLPKPFTSAVLLQRVAELLEDRADFNEIS